jgi:hypothetical protein
MTVSAGEYVPAINPVHVVRHPSTASRLVARLVHRMTPTVVDADPNLLNGHHVHMSAANPHR